MSPKSEELSDLMAKMAAKEAECESHKGWTKDLSETLRHPECGLVVKMARLETILLDIKEGQTWLFRGLVAVLLAVVGWMAVQLHDNMLRESEQRLPASGETKINPSSFAAK